MMGYCKDVVFLIEYTFKKMSVYFVCFVNKNVNVNVFLTMKRASLHNIRTCSFL